MSQEFFHEPVMLTEVLELLGRVPEGVVLDATLGGGGHAAALLAARPDIALLGLDQDRRAVEFARARLSGEAGRVTIEQVRFDRLSTVVAEVLGPGARLSGALFDLGVSSAQIDDPERGFSYQHDGPLDMRMDERSARSAADLVNGASVGELAELFSEHGEGRLSRRIAQAIVAGRPITSTTSLAAIVAAAVPAAMRRRGHPASRVFQALRVAVNGELEILASALDDALGLLAPGGRLVVLSYHSGEDRITKQVLARAGSGGCTCPPTLPCVCGAVAWARVLTRGARLPSESETTRNPRARAARLRAAERLDAPVRELR